MKPVLGIHAQTYVYVCMYETCLIACFHYKSKTIGWSHVVSNPTNTSMILQQGGLPARFLDFFR